MGEAFAVLINEMIVPLLFGWLAAMAVVGTIATPILSGFALVALFQFCQRRVKGRTK